MGPTGQLSNLGVAENRGRIPALRAVVPTLGCGVIVDRVPRFELLR
jgi:hypothetical protein